MNLPDINWKYLAIAVALIVVIALLLAFLPQALSAKAINAYFSPTNKVAPGQSTNLIVELTNTLDKDATSYDISVSAVNEGVTIGEFTLPEGTIGKSEMRKITVPISLSQDLLDGTYSVQINVDLEGALFSSRVTLEVKK